MQSTPLNQGHGVTLTTADVGGGRQTKKQNLEPRRPFTQPCHYTASMSLSQSYPLPLEAGTDRISLHASSMQSSDGPIVIQSDTDSEADDLDDESSESIDHDRQDIDDSQSNKPLPSLNVITPSIGEAQEGKEIQLSELLYILLLMIPIANQRTSASQRGA